MKRRKAGLFGAVAASLAFAFSAASAADAPAADAEARKKGIFASLQETQDGREVAAMLDKHDIKTALVDFVKLNAISPCEDAAEDAGVAGGIAGKTLLLNAGLPDKDMKLTIVHEARHVWQTQDLGAYAHKMDTLEKAVLLTIFREADAFAREMRFAYAHEQATGESLVFLPSRLRKLDGYRAVYALYRLDRESGMPEALADRNLLRNAMELAGTLGYAERAAANFSSAAKTRPVSDQAFASLLRKISSGALEGKSDAEVLAFVRAHASSTQHSKALPPESASGAKRALGAQAACPK